MSKRPSLALGPGDFVNVSVTLRGIKRHAGSPNLQPSVTLTQSSHGTRLLPGAEVLPVGAEAVGDALVGLVSEGK